MGLQIEGLEGRKSDVSRSVELGEQTDADKVKSDASAKNLSCRVGAIDGQKLNCNWYNYSFEKL